MKTAKKPPLYKKASNELQLINQSWEHMPDGSMSFLLCHDLKECLLNLMQCFIQLKKGKPSKSKDIAHLVSECAKIDKRFNKIDLRWFSCKEHEQSVKSDVFCYSADRVKACTWIANGIKRILDAELKKAAVALTSLLPFVDFALDIIEWA